MTIQPIQALGGKGLLAKAPDALKTDTLVFLSCRHAVNLDTGALPRGGADIPPAARQMYASARYIDPMEWPMTAQTWWIYEAFRRILEPLGATLDDLVRTNTYFRDLEDFPAMERARAQIIPVNPPPSTVLTVPYGQFPAGADLAIEGVAILPTAGRREPVHAQLGTGAHFLWGNRVKEVLWAAGQTAGHPMTGEFVTRVKDLGLEGRHLATNNVHLDAREGRVTAQAWMAYWRVKTILEGAGLGLNDIIQEKIYLRSLKHLPAVERVRRGLYKPNSAPPHFYVEIVDVGRNTDCLIEVDAIAATAGRELLSGAGDDLGRLGASGCAQGDYIYLGGSTARQENGSVAEGLAAQAKWIYERLGKFLGANGSSLKQMAKVDLYVREDADLSALDGVHSSVFGGSMPAVSIIPMRRIDHDDAVELKVSGVACRARR